MSHATQDGHGANGSIGWGDLLFPVAIGVLFAIKPWWLLAIISAGFAAGAAIGRWYALEGECRRIWGTNCELGLLEMGALVCVASGWMTKLIFLGIGYEIPHHLYTMH